MRWTRRAGLLGAAVFLAAIGFGCGGEGGGAGNNLSGEITTDRFEVPAGETQTVTGDTTVRSTGDIVIGGNLQLTEGASLALIADGDLVIDGGLKGSEGEATRSRAGSAVNPAIVLTGRNILIREAAPGTEFGNVVAPPGTNVFMATNGIGLVESRGAVLAGPGHAATAQAEPGEEGGAEDGCNVEIGTQRAIEAARLQGASNPNVPGDVRLIGSALLRGGAAGRGFDDLEGRIEGRTLRLRSTSGGDGGEVHVRASRLALLSGEGRLEPLIRGGFGGEAGRVQGRAPNGAVFFDSGFSLSFVTGNGGQGGSVVLQAATIEDHELREVRSGNGGHGPLAVVAAGAGAASGDGGSIEGFIGARGRPGESNELVSAGEPGLGTRVLIEGSGNGGDAQQVRVPGGSGGFIRLISLFAPVPAEGFLVITESCNGGGGLSGCPNEPGGNGGGVNAVPGVAFAGVSLTTAGLTLVQSLDAPVPAPPGNSFNGGDAGDGNPPGAGGEPGLDENNVPLGEPGDDGKPCPINDDGGGGDGGGAISETEPNESCDGGTPMGSANTAFGFGNGGNDVDVFTKEDFTVGRYRVTTSVALTLNIEAGQFTTGGLQIPPGEGEFVIRELPGRVCFQVFRPPPDESYSFQIEKISDDPGPFGPNG